jgi:hypothetical protein
MEGGHLKFFRLAKLRQLFEESLAKLRQMLEEIVFNRYEMYRLGHIPVLAKSVLAVIHA